MYTCAFLETITFTVIQVLVHHSDDYCKLLQLFFAWVISTRITYVPRGCYDDYINNNNNNNIVSITDNPYAHLHVSSYVYLVTLVNCRELVKSHPATFPQFKWLPYSK